MPFNPKNMENASFKNRSDSAVSGGRALAPNDIEKGTDQYEWNKCQQIAPRPVKERVMRLRPVIKRGVDAIECAGKKCDNNSGNCAACDVSRGK
jgi:hypothetical protein